MLFSNYIEQIRYWLKQGRSSRMHDRWRRRKEKNHTSALGWFHWVVLTPEKHHWCNLSFSWYPISASTSHQHVFKQLGCGHRILTLSRGTAGAPWCHPGAWPRAQHLGHQFQTGSGPQPANSTGFKAMLTGMGEIKFIIVKTSKTTPPAVRAPCLTTIRPLPYPPDREKSDNFSKTFAQPWFYLYRLIHHTSR